MTEVQQRKGDVKGSQEGAITHHDGGTTLTGDATLLPRALYCKKGIEWNLSGSKMLLTRGATITVLLGIASEFTGKKYTTSKASKEQAVKDLQTWIDTMRAALPINDERTKKDQE